MVKNFNIIVLKLKYEVLWKDTKYDLNKRKDVFEWEILIVLKLI